MIIMPCALSGFLCCVCDVLIVFVVCVLCDRVVVIIVLYGVCLNNLC